MKIGEIASKTEVSRDTIRLYERMGLLSSVTRPNPYNNYKDYGPENVVRIHLIKEMKRIGLTLNECREVIDALVNDEMSQEQRVEFIRGKVREVQEKIKSLQQVKTFLQQHLDADCAFNSDEMIARLRGDA